MKKSRFILLLISLCVLTSCAEEKALYVIESSENAYAYLVSSSRFIEVEISSAELESWRSYSSLSGEESFSSLFALECASYAFIDEKNLEEYRRNLEMLAKGLDSPDGYTAWKRYEKDLRKTAFENTMNELSAPFETEKLLKASGETVLSSVPLSGILTSSAPWDEKSEFLKLWAEAALR